MKRLVLLAALLAALFAAAPGHAAQMMMCAPAGGGGSQGPRPVGTYQFNASGCAAIQLADIPLFTTAGYVQRSSEQSIVFNTGVATGTTNFLIGQLPSGGYIKRVVVNNVTTNAAGNVALGSTSGGVDIVAAVACGSSCLLDATIAKPLFSATAPTLLNISSTAWNSANVNITVIYGLF